MLDELVALGSVVVVSGHGEVTDASLLRDVRVPRSRERRGRRLRESGATVEETVAAIDEEARARWSMWERPEWIAFAARAFYDNAAR
ncbi:hypothetical protein AB0K12_47785 [Nonomuraea sp. NPDC049419]|uniref:hypothetical protein n=1 Tax=Nonomuraea sp. NPDC049419 TaxID=3155772 RepID=UPI00342D9D4F